MVTLAPQPVSIKPATYKAKPGLSEQIDVPIIFYSKEKDEVVIEFDEKSSVDF